MCVCRFAGSGGAAADDPFAAACECSGVYERQSRKHLYMSIRRFIAFHSTTAFGAANHFSGLRSVKYAGSEVFNDQSDHQTWQ